MDHEHEHGTPTAPATCKLNMVFHAGHCERILWTWWVASEVGEFIGSCFALGALAFAMEAIKYWREVLTRKECKRLAELNDVHCDGQYIADDTRYCERISTTANFVEAILYFLQMTIAYMVMLAFMNYNYWLCLSIILGLCLGHLLFGYAKIDAYMEEDCCNEKEIK